MADDKLSQWWASEISRAVAAAGFAGEMSRIDEYMEQNSTAARWCKDVGTEVGLQVWLVENTWLDEEPRFGVMRAWPTERPFPLRSRLFG